ncbi:MAG: uroporphyrinogen decarboxylase family protein, partial [Dehalococcoidia bacterium]
MAQLTKKERVRAALAGKPLDRVPVSMWGHDFLREWSAQDLVDATLDAYRAHDWDFIKLNPRATYFAEAWGATYGRPKEQHQPRVLTNAVNSVEDLMALRPVDPRAGVFGEQLDALRLLLAEVGDEVDVVHTVFSPLGVAGRLCESDARFREYAATNPAAAHTALATLTETLIAYSEASLDVGAAGLFYAPLAWASYNTCDEDFYREFGRPYDLQLLARVRGAPFNILHVCRDHNMIDLLLDYPVAAFNWADRE